MGKPTIYTIAKQCGVSHATVSMALHNNPLVAAATRARIQKVADEVRYRPNRLALSLKTGMSNVIGFVIPSFTYPYYSLIAEYVFREAAQKGYQVQFVLSGSDLGQESRAIEECMDAQVDGLIVRSVARSREDLSEDHVLRKIEKIKFPCVTGNSQLGFSGVSLDHYQASRLAVQHLLEQGYEEIRLLQLGGGDQEDSKVRYPASNRSIEGFREALKEGGIPYHPSMLISRDVMQSDVEASSGLRGTVGYLKYIEYNQYEAFGAEMVKQVLAESNGGRVGIVFGHDQMACAAWRYCMSEGIRVPQDVGLVGRGDVLTYMLPLTTIGWDYEEQAKGLVSILLAEINSAEKQESRLLTPYLAARGSTASSE